MTIMEQPVLPHLGFVLERALGHVTHAENLKALLPRQSGVEVAVHEVPYETTGFIARIPFYSNNWTVRAGLRARRGIRRMDHHRWLDALFMHTQVPAVLCADWVHRIPTVISVDATPRQYDQFGEHYDHQREGRIVEAAKWRANHSCFHHAAHVVAWSEWTKRGLTTGYGVDPDKVSVIPPGVLRSLWAPSTPSAPHRGPVRILFVGGALERKGGDLLLDAFQDVRAELGNEGRADDVELHLATGAPIREAPGVVVHEGLEPNSSALVELYHRSDIFCLPTRADTHAIVLSEAATAGLPIVATAIAGLPEVVRDDETGLIVPVDDRVALVRALLELVRSPELRQRLGHGAGTLAARDLDAEKNTRRLVELVASFRAERPRARRGLESEVARAR